MSLYNTFYVGNEIFSFAKKSRKIYFSGIGGAGMSGIAAIIKSMGYTVCGYDRVRSETTEKLRAIGIDVFYDFDTSRLSDCSLFVYTVAIPEDAPDYVYAREHNIPCVSRANVVGCLMGRYRNSIAVCGMHGKSTTTAMIDAILNYAKKFPTTLVGADMTDTGCGYRIGGREVMIAEACEYMESFLAFSPNIVVALNIELEHTDFYKSLDEVKSSFLKFVNLPSVQVCVINKDDENIVSLIPYIKPCIITCSVDGSADITAKNVENNGGYYTFELRAFGNNLGKCKLNVPGRHNVSNALSAYAAAICADVGKGLLGHSLDDFYGIGRRMELKGKIGNCIIYEDYAHHPSEISATLHTLRDMSSGRICCVFQPHTYSRTQSFKNEFAEVLDGFDGVILAEIYPAREENTYKISSLDIIGLMRNAAEYAGDIESAAELAREACKAYDIVVVMGAGDIHKVIKMLGL